jgi:hypothetical protein
MYRLIQEYKARADVVLVDSPPLWYSDALALAPQVDGVLLVVSSGTTGRENTINAVESLRLVGARIIGTVLNRVKAGPAYFYYPTYAANRVALDSSGSMAAISAGAAPRALAAAPRAPEAPAITEQAAPESSAPAISGGLVEPSEELGASAGNSAPDASAPASPYATAFIDAAAPASHMAMPGEAAETADESDISHAIGEAVAAYKNDDQMLNSNGHGSASQRRGRHR